MAGQIVKLPNLPESAVEALERIKAEGPQQVIVLFRDDPSDLWAMDYGGEVDVHALAVASVCLSLEAQQLAYHSYEEDEEDD